jgi:hypothetical protein
VTTPGEPGDSFSTTVEQPVKALISPNPFNDQLTINMPQGEATLTILDARGARVLQKETIQTTITLDLGSLNAGVDWLNIRSAKGSEARKIIKQ